MVPTIKVFYAVKRANRSVAIALAVGLALTAIAVIAVLTRSPLVLAGTNSVSAKNYIEVNHQGKVTTCQPSGTIPKGTSAIRIGIEGIYFGPPTTVKIFKSSHVLGEGRQIPGGAAAPTVTAHVGSLDRPVRNARICMTVGPMIGPLRYYGVPKNSAPPGADPLQQATLHLEYLRPAGKSWLTLASSIAYHMGLGRAPNGTWVAFLVIALGLVVVLLASRIAIEELR